MNEHNCYILIHPDEDGNTVSFIPREELNDVKKFLENYGIKELFTEIPNEKDPQYWDENSALLIEFSVKKIKAIKVVEKYEIE